MDFSQFDSRPVLVAIAGPNGAGKTTFYHAHLRPAALPLINADEIVQELDLEPYAAARVADSLRRELVKRRESFVFETVFSDPVGNKLGFLKEAAESGFTVGLCFIGISGPAVSESRVAMRVSQGGHDVPSEKLSSRFPRTMANLKAAVRELPHVLIFDNDDLQSPYRLVVTTGQGCVLTSQPPIPEWLRPLLP